MADEDDGSRPASRASSRGSRGSRGSRTAAEWDVDKHMVKLTGGLPALSRPPVCGVCAAGRLKPCLLRACARQTPTRSTGPKAAGIWWIWASAATSARESWVCCVSASVRLCASRVLRQRSR